MPAGQYEGFTTVPQWAVDAQFNGWFKGAAAGVYLWSQHRSEDHTDEESLGRGFVHYLSTVWSGVDVGDEEALIQYRLKLAYTREEYDALELLKQKKAQLELQDPHAYFPLRAFYPFPEVESLLTAHDIVLASAKDNMQRGLEQMQLLHSDAPVPSQELGAFRSTLETFKADCQLLHWQETSQLPASIASHTALEEYRSFYSRARGLGLVNQDGDITIDQAIENAKAHESALYASAQQRIDAVVDTLRGMESAEMLEVTTFYQLKEQMMELNHALDGLGFSPEQGSLRYGDDVQKQRLREQYGVFQTLAAGRYLDDQGRPSLQKVQEEIDTWVSDRWESASRAIQGLMSHWPAMDSGGNDLTAKQCAAFKEHVDRVNKVMKEEFCHTLEQKMQYEEWMAYIARHPYLDVGERQLDYSPAFSLAEKWVHATRYMHEMREILDVMEKKGDDHLSMSDIARFQGAVANMSVLDKDHEFRQSISVAHPEWAAEYRTFQGALVRHRYLEGSRDGGFRYDAHPDDPTRPGSVRFSSLFKDKKAELTKRLLKKRICHARLLLLFMICKLTQ